VRTGQYDYDDYGDVLDAIEKTQGGVTTETAATYDNLTADWLIGLRRTEDVTSYGFGAPVPAPRRRAYDYDARGLLCHAYTEKDDPDPSIPQAVTFTHDAEGLLRAVTASAVGKPYMPRGAAWAVIGMTVHVTEDAGGEAATDYDELGRVVGRGHKGFGGEWIEQATTYDKLGRVETVSRPDVGMPSAYVTTYLYDNLDRPLAEIRPAPNETVTYQHTFFSTQTWDPLGHETDVDRDLDDRVIDSVEYLDGQARTTTFAYGAFGQVDHVTDPKKHTIITHYDRRGRRDSIQDPDAGLMKLRYDGFGDVEQRTAGGDVTRYAYDVLGRRIQADDVEGATTFTWDTAPHGAGKLVHTKSVDGTLQDYSYDSLGRLDTLTYTVDGKPYAFTQKYDSSGRPSSLAYPEAPGRPRFTTGRTYNPSGFLKSTYDASLGGDPALSPHYFRADGRNAEDRLLAGMLGNGIASIRTYEDASGRLSTLSEGTAQALAYTYDLDGQVQTKGELETNRSERYDYDELHRLKSWTLEGRPETDYHYDDHGNLDEVRLGGVLQEKFFYGSGGRPHALATSAAGQYGYDARGREKSAPGRKTTYTDFDLPRTIGATTFSYDALGERVKKDGPSGAVITLAHLYERRESAGQVVHVFYVPGEDGAVAQITYDESRKGSTAEYLHEDPLGSVGVVTDGGGALVERLFYEPFGARVHANGSPLGAAPPGDVLMGFAGHRNDDDLGLVDMRGRVYEPGTRRFLTPDPYVHDPLGSQSYNRYAYVLGNPTNLVDPSGLDGEPAPDYPAGCGGAWTCHGWSASGGSIEIGLGPTGGSSGVKGATGGPVVGPEGGRPVSLPTGPTAPAVSITGPRVAGALAPGASSGPDNLEDWIVAKGDKVAAGVALAGLAPLAIYAAVAPMTVAFGTSVAGWFVGLGTAAVGGRSVVQGAAEGDAGKVIDGAVVALGGLEAMRPGLGAGPRAAGAPSLEAAEAEAAQSAEAGAAGAKRGPKPWPEGAHNETIARRIEELEAQGYEHLNGGGKREEFLPIENGYKSARRPDIAMRAPDGSIYRENVGRTLANGSPVQREVEALDDIQSELGVRPGFTPYDQ
jgi:RHS repeat-associated protein